ncbi:MAG: alkanesulfonate monooxygenase [Acidimicrobiales bacterium mtb01]|nr:LLM class flavin-dependent oxidoreductase [Actinomycetota bacterium]TEX45541.1 MAG: alkanesulfonate monooxygenase [Acidimicrobiales bacterium mtb01]
MTAPGRCEISWFAALCDDDYEQLGVVRSDLRSSWEHCRAIVEQAERSGFDNVLLPSGYALGIDAVAFAGGMAACTSSIRLLVAVRCGEMWTPQLARQIATLDHMLGGRLTVNIISSEMPGESLDGPARYRRTGEVMAALRDLLSGRSIGAEGEFVSVDVAPPRIAEENRGCPPLYFGGLSDEARDVAAQHADVYLMWPDTIDVIGDLVNEMTERASAYGRSLRFGYRAHVVVRESEHEARAAADHIVAALDDETGAAIRARSLDSQSTGVRRQAELRESASRDGFVEDHLWTGIGRGRSGCGAAIVGDPHQVAGKIEQYRSLGIEAFILSGYPHRDECRRVGDLVLPLLEHGPLEIEP